MVNYNDILPSNEERAAYMRKRELDPEKMAKMSKGEVTVAMRELLFSLPYDARFPHNRQTNRCRTYYTDFYRCRELLGVDYKPCEYFKTLYLTVCHRDLVERMDELRKMGAFRERFDR
uniref:NADH dehydrogenase [ubiquinone] 1 beta subcomplex subunit 7 n=1 Tax=Syphacia muris TaxID=451379 RepID=A0A0N5AF40_9BILA